MWIVYAMMAAVFFGFRGVLYQWTSQQNMNRNLMLFGVFFTGFVISAVAMVVLQQSWNSWGSVLVGLGMGFGSYAANASLYKGFAVGKASIVSVLAGLPPLFVVLIAFIVWREMLSGPQMLGFAIIFIGIYLIRYSNDISLKNLQGAQWGLLAALFFAANDLLGKQSTRLDADMFATLLLMFGFGSVLFAVSWLRGRDRSNRKESDLKRWSEQKTFIVGMGVGLTNVAGMMAILPAFATGTAGLVSAIAALNILIILLYTRVFLKEPFTTKEIAGLAAALAGIIILRLSQ